MASCKSCGAPIEWAHWETSGKATPIDAAPAANGNLAVVNGKIHKYTAEDARLARDRRTSHFATCPDAQDWRSR